MPKLLFFAPCTQAILGQDDTLSLIVIINQMKVNIGENSPDPLPLNAAATMKWSAVSQWYRLPGEENVSFEQKIELIDEDGVARRAPQTTTEFALPAQRHTVIASFTFWPVLPDGTYNLRLSLRKVGDAEWGVAAEYPVHMESAREAAETLTWQPQ